jgi:hypothetical protein
VFVNGEHWAERTKPFACPKCGCHYLGCVPGHHQKKQLHSGSAEKVFVEFVRRYPLAKTPREHAAIDRLLHEFHEHYQFGDTRPAAPT